MQLYRHDKDNLLHNKWSYKSDGAGQNLFENTQLWSFCPTHFIYQIIAPPSDLHMSRSITLVQSVEHILPTRFSYAFRNIWGQVITKNEKKIGIMISI